MQIVCSGTCAQAHRIPHTYCTIQTAPNCKLWDGNGYEDGDSDDNDDDEDDDDNYSLVIMSMHSYYASASLFIHNYEHS
jgi:hypothetical protein